MKKRAAKNDHVRCGACGAPWSVAQVLAACSVSWPNQKWLLFECPGCREEAHVEVADGTLAAGSLDGGPGPCFFPDQTLSVPGLKVTADAKGVTVRLDGKRTRVPARM